MTCFAVIIELCSIWTLRCCLLWLNYYGMNKVKFSLPYVSSYYFIWGSDIESIERENLNIRLWSDLVLLISIFFCYPKEKNRVPWQVLLSSYISFFWALFERLQIAKLFFWIIAWCSFCSWGAFQYFVCSIILMWPKPVQKRARKFHVPYF